MLLTFVERDPSNWILGGVIGIGSVVFITFLVQMWNIRRETEHSFKEMHHVAWEKRELKRKMKTIDTAPQDSSRVLAWRDGWVRPMWMRWWILDSGTDKGYWSDASGWGEEKMDREPPTHWIPVPIPREGGPHFAYRTRLNREGEDKWTEDHLCHL